MTGIFELLTRTKTICLCLGVSLVFFSNLAAQGDDNIKKLKQRVTALEEQVSQATAKGVAWVAAQQNADGSWGTENDRFNCGKTGLAIKMLLHHAIDPTWGLGLPSPFDEGNPHRADIEAGLDFLFEECAGMMTIIDQPAGDPDTDGDDRGVYFVDSDDVPPEHRTYASSIALMVLCEAVELDRIVRVGPLEGWTFEDVARGTMDYLGFSQNDTGEVRGGWGYHEGWETSDNSNSGYVALALGFAQASPPVGCGFTIPRFVKDELSIWIDAIQDDITGGCDYEVGLGMPNILRTGNLMQQMALVGDTTSTPRVQAALVYMAANWDRPSQDPGWKGDDVSSNYQSAFTSMKGFQALGVNEFGMLDWAADFETELLAEQNSDGSWPLCDWSDEQLILSTTWAVLTLERAAPLPSRHYTLSFPHFGNGTASGSSLMSQIRLLNLSSATAEASIDLHDDEGKPLSMMLNGSLVIGETEISIPPYGASRLSTDGLGPMRTGSVTVLSDTETEGFILYRSSSNGVAGVPSSPAVCEASVPVERSSGVNSGIAIQNLSPRQQVKLKLRDEAGNLVTLAYVELPENGHLAKFITEFDWDSPPELTDFSGSLTLVAPNPFAATAILLTPEGYATLPVAPIGDAH